MLSSDTRNTSIFILSTFKMAPFKLPKGNGRKTKLTVNTTTANARNSDSDDVFGATFHSNDRTLNDQPVESTLPGEEVFGAIIGANAREYDDQSAQPPHPLRKSQSSRSIREKFKLFNASKATRSPRPHLHTSRSALTTDERSELEDSYEELRTIAEERGFEEDELLTIVEHVCDCGLINEDGEVELDLVAHEAQLEARVQAQEEALLLTNDNTTIKEIETSILQANYGTGVSSTKELVDKSKIHFIPAVRSRNSIYFHNNSDISSVDTLRPSSFNSPSPLSPVNASMLLLPMDRSKLVHKHNHKDDARESGSGASTPTTSRALFANPEYKKYGSPTRLDSSFEVVDPNTSPSGYVAPQGGSFELFPPDTSKFNRHNHDSGGTDNTNSPKSLHHTWSSSTSASSGGHTQSSESSDNNDAPSPEPLRYNKGVASLRNSFRPQGRSPTSGYCTPSRKRQHNNGGNSADDSIDRFASANLSDDEDISTALKSSPLCREKRKGIATEVSASPVDPSAIAGVSTVNEAGLQVSPTQAELSSVSMFASAGVDADAREGSNAIHRIPTLSEIFDRPHTPDSILLVTRAVEALPKLDTMNIPRKSVGSGSAPPSGDVSGRSRVSPKYIGRPSPIGTFTERDSGGGLLGETLRARIQAENEEASKMAYASQKVTSSPSVTLQDR